jgi:NAD+ kinase
MKIAVFGNSFLKEKAPQAGHFLSKLQSLGVKLLIDETYFRFLNQNEGAIEQPESLIMDDHFSADMALSLGGDGTFLQTAMMVGDKGIPLIGINMGRLGFLADVTFEETDELIADLMSGNYHIEERSLLQLVSHSSDLTFNVALNDIAVLKRDTSSLINIKVEINGQFLNSYQADGLVIATPTGSTAYSLSVGGPIIVPDSNAVILTPVAPHSLNVRPLVISNQNEITLTVTGRARNFLVAIDGRSSMISNGEKLVIRKAKYTLKVVKRTNSSFFNTLREKLMWGADKRV